VITQSAKDTIK